MLILEAQICVRFVEERLMLLARRQIIHVLRLSIRTMAVLQRLPQLLQLLPQPALLLVGRVVIIDEPLDHPVFIRQLIE